MVYGAMSLPGRCECKIHYKCGKEKALRVIPRGKQRLTVYRAHQVSKAISLGRAFGENRFRGCTEKMIFLQGWQSVAHAERERERERERDQRERSRGQGNFCSKERNFGNERGMAKIWISVCISVVFLKTLVREGFPSHTRSNEG